MSIPGLAKGKLYSFLNYPNIMEDDKSLKIMKPIASGSFGKVYRAWKRDIGEIVAVKVERRNAS